MEGEREKDEMSVGGENKGTGEMEGRGGEKGERLQMNVLRQVVTSVTTSLYSHAHTLSASSPQHTLLCRATSQHEIRHNPQYG